MKCPHCSRPVDHEATTCYSCGYSLSDAEAVFGRNYVKMNRLHDAAHCLRKPELDDIDEVLDRLEFRFPQMLFSAYLGALNDSMRLNELGFWLLNHAEIRGSDYARPNENAVLVLLDVNSKQAGISLGYFVETLISEEDGYACLQAARPYLLNGNYGRAMTRLFKKIGRTLSRNARKLRRVPLNSIGSPGETPPSSSKRKLIIDAPSPPKNPVAAAVANGYNG